MYFFWSGRSLYRDIFVYYRGYQNIKFLCLDIIIISIIGFIEGNMANQSEVKQVQ